MFNEKIPMLYLDFLFNMQEPTNTCMTNFVKVRPEHNQLLSSPFVESQSWKGMYMNAGKTEKGTYEDEQGCDLALEHIIFATNLYAIIGRVIEAHDDGDTDLTKKQRYLYLELISAHSPEGATKPQLYTIMSMNIPLRDIEGVAFFNMILYRGLDKDAVIKNVMNSIKELSEKVANHSDPEFVLTKVIHNEYDVDILGTVKANEVEKALKNAVDYHCDLLVARIPDIDMNVFSPSETQTIIKVKEPYKHLSATFSASALMKYKM